MDVQSMLASIEKHYFLNKATKPFIEIIKTVVEYVNNSIETVDTELKNILGDE